MYSEREFEEMEDYQDYQDVMCNMADIDADEEDANEEEFDENATKSIASTIDDFVERTPVNRIRAFREKIMEMRNSWLGTIFLIIITLSLAISLFYWDETKQIIYTQYANIGSAIGFFRLSSNT